MVPIAFYGFFDFCSIIEKFRFEKTEKATSKSTQPQIIVNDSNILSDLAHINYVFLDKTGTLTKKKLEISKIFVNEKIYEFDAVSLKSRKSRLSPPKKEKEQCSEDNLKNYEEQMINLQIPSFQALLPKNKLTGKVPDSETERFMTDNNREEKNNFGETALEIHTDQMLPSKKNISLVNLKEPGEEFFNDINKEKSIQSLVRGFAFCHNARVVYEGVEKSYFHSKRKEEEILLDFAKTTGFSLEQVTNTEAKKVYLIRDHDKKNNYGIIGTNDFSYSRRRFSLLMEEIDGESTLYCKGNLEAIKDRLILTEEDSEHLGNLTNYFKEEGVKLVVYASRRFNKEETKDFSNQLRNLKFSLTNQEDELEELANQMEIKMDLLGIVGFKEQIRKEVPQMIEFFKNIDAAIWVVSGDSETNVMNTVINSKIINISENESFQIHAENIEDISISIRNILTEIRIILDPFKLNNNSSHQKQDSKGDSQPFNKVRKSLKLNRGMTLGKKDIFQNKFLVVNGKSLDIIFRNAYLRDHFIFIASFMKILVGYNLSPQNKETLVKIVRNNFVDNQNVLAIGDGFNDSLMMQAANVGIELMHKQLIKPFIPEKKPDDNQIQIQVEPKKVFLPEINCGDIIINNLELVKFLMINKGVDLYERFNKLIGLLNYKDILIGMTLFVYNWAYNFSNHQLYESYFVLFYGHVLFILPIICFALYNKTFKIEVLNFFPALYLDSKRKISLKFPKVFVKNFVEGILTSIMIIYVSSFIMGAAIDCNGKEIDFVGVRWVFVFSLIFIMIFKVILIYFYLF